MIYILLFLAALVIQVWYVCHHVTVDFLPEMLSLHKAALESSVEKIDVMAASIQKMANINIEGARGTAAAHRDGLRDTLKAHADALTAVTASHGEAAQHLAASARSHNEAASTGADSTLQMRQAAEQLKTLLGDANLLRHKPAPLGDQDFMLPK